jgi:hypothetical protein
MLTCGFISRAEKDGQEPRHANVLERLSSIAPALPIRG